MSFKTPISSLHIYDDTRKNEVAQRVLQQFESIDFYNSGSSIVQPQLENLAEKSGALDVREVNRILKRLHDMRLLPSLTIEYDHSKWLKHSKTKGCLVVYVSIEKSDYDKSNLGDKVASEIVNIRDLILKEHKKECELSDVIIVPNVHLAPYANLGNDSIKDVKLLNEIVDSLKNKGMRTKLNSYGYSKDIQLAIDAHKLGYISRCF